MTSWDTQQLLAMLNLVLCLGTAWACICRLNSDICRRWRLARMRYTLLLTGALAHGAQPLLFGSLPGVAGVIFSAGVFASLLLGVERWRGVEAPAPAPPPAPHV